MLYFLTTSVGAVILVNYLLIAASPYRLRRRLERDAVRLPVPAFPLIDLVTIGALGAVLISMLFDASLRSQLAYTVVSILVICAVRLLTVRGRRSAARLAVELEHT